MRIAIYGDSWGVTNDLPTSWPSILADKLSGHLDNFCEPGASVYYSYTKFTQTHHDYDVVIFLVGEPHRYPVKVELTDGLRFFPALFAIESYRKEREVPAIDNKILNDIEGWFKASSTEYMMFIHSMFLDKIRSERPSVILYPCLLNSLDKNILSKENINPMHILSNLYAKQLEMLGYNTDMDTMVYTGLHENKNVISGHLAPEINNLVAEMLYNKIVTGEYVFFDLKDIKLLHPKEYYYCEES